MVGWVRIDRNAWEHGFFDREPMSEREAWFWMIASAAWEDTSHKVGAMMYPVPRGTFMTTLRQLQSRFMWRSETKVRNFLKRLEAERMIERSAVGPRNARKTHVTICNYDKFQDARRPKDARKTFGETLGRRSKVTSKQNNKPPNPQRGLSSDLEIAASRIRNGEAFDASYLSGWKREKLLESGLVTATELERYG